MTAVVSWLGVDQRGPSSLYIAADSLFVWGASEPTYKFGKKIFACRYSPEIFGFCGDVLFPSQSLDQLVNVIDECRETFLLKNFDSKLEFVLEFLRNKVNNYPVEKIEDPVTIVFGSRIGSEMLSKFHHVEIAIKGRDFKVQRSLLPENSAEICTLGTGKTNIDVALSLWSNKPTRTSRYVFSAFCEAIADGNEATVGGPPQLAGLWRKGAPQIFVTTYEGGLYVLGSSVSSDHFPSGKPGFNERFERWDPLTNLIVVGAQKHRRKVGS